MAESEEAKEEIKEEYDILLRVRFDDAYPFPGFNSDSHFRDFEAKVKEKLKDIEYIFYDKNNKAISNGDSKIIDIAKIIKKSKKKDSKKQYIIEANKDIQEDKVNGTVIAKVRYDDEYEYQSVKGSNSFKDLMGKMTENDDKYVFYDKNKKKILDMDAQINTLAQWDKRKGKYVVDAEEESDIGKEYIDLPEKMEWDLHKSDGGTKAPIIDGNAPVIGGGDSTLSVVQVEDLHFIKKKRLFKGNRRLLYGRIPAESGIINADYRMFDLREDIDWNNDNCDINIKSYDVLFSDLSRSSQIIESSSSFSTSLAESCYVSAEVAVDATGYGSVSIGAKHETNKTKEEENNYFSLTARSTINCAQILVNHESVRYTNGFMNDLNELLSCGTTYLSHWKRFIQKYGFFYHDKARLGGTAYMSHISESSQTVTTEEEKQEIKAEMEASYSFVSAKASFAAGRSSSKSSKSTKSTSNKQLNCNGGRPDLCSFDTFSNWESSLNDSRLWAVTEAISIKPFYHLLSTKTKTRIFELVPGFRRFMSRFKESYAQEMNLSPEEQTSDFFGFDTLKKGTKWNGKMFIFRAVEFINNGILPGFSLKTEPQTDDYNKEEDKETPKHFCYHKEATIINEEDKTLIKFARTEVINKVSIWMDSEETKIIGMQFVTNIGQRINVIPPLYTAMQLLDIKLNDSWKNQLKMDQWVDTLKPNDVLKMYNNIWDESNRGWMDAVIESIDKTDKGLSLRMRWKSHPQQQDGNARNIEEYDEIINIMYGHKNCHISAYNQDSNQREVLTYSLRSKLRDYWLYRVKNGDSLRKLKNDKWIEVQVIDKTDVSAKGFKLKLAVNVDDEKETEIEILYDDNNADNSSILRPKKANKNTNTNIVFGTISKIENIEIGNYVDLDKGTKIVDETKSNDDGIKTYKVGDKYPIVMHGCHLLLKYAFDAIIKDSGKLGEILGGKRWFKYMQENGKTLSLTEDIIANKAPSVITYTSAGNCVLWEISSSYPNRVIKSFVIYYQPRSDSDKIFDLDEGTNFGPSKEFALNVLHKAPSATVNGHHMRLKQSFDDIVENPEIMKHEVPQDKDWREIVKTTGCALEWDNILNADDTAVITYTRKGNYVLWKIDGVEPPHGSDGDKISIKSTIIDHCFMSIRSTIIHNKEMMSNLTLNVDVMKEFRGTVIEEKENDAKFSIKSVGPTTFVFDGKHNKLKQDFDDIIRNPKAMKTEVPPDAAVNDWWTYFQQNGKEITKQDIFDSDGATFITYVYQDDEMVYLLWKIVETEQINESHIVSIESAVIHKELNSAKPFSMVGLRSEEIVKFTQGVTSDEEMFVIEVKTSKQLDGIHVKIKQSFDDIVKNPRALENEVDDKDWRKYIRHNGKRTIRLEKENLESASFITYTKNKSYVLWKMTSAKACVGDYDFTTSISTAVIPDMYPYYNLYPLYHMYPYNRIYQLLSDLSEQGMFDYDDAIAVSVILQQQQHLWRGNREISKEIIKSMLKQMKRLSQDLCVRKDVVGDKLNDLQVIEKEINNTTYIEGIQFKFLMYS